ncbi:MAG TPA: EscU/YscU/HrcU family type III secretion system export apparatus switch protein [Symbiobacteriaceae bacterium]
MSGRQRKRKAAVALRYRPDRDPAPRVLAAARGQLAEALLRAAREHGVPVRTDPVLAEGLADLRPGEVIPPALYEAVARVLAFLWRLEQEKSAEEGRQP